ncbi:MAG: hypothetical protein ONB05_04785 [candidate division KSB1 bacterium]|nr:hypothetical protein [candidate division KSB1 bacterium]
MDYSDQEKWPRFLNVAEFMERVYQELGYIPAEYGDWATGRWVSGELNVVGLQAMKSIPMKGMARAEAIEVEIKKKGVARAEPVTKQVQKKAGS